MRTVARVAPAPQQEWQSTRRAAASRSASARAASPAGGGHSFGRIAVHASAAAVRPKLAIGAPGDVYEREADAVADLVMRLGDAGPPREISPQSISRAPSSVRRGVQRLSSDQSPSLDDAVVSEREEEKEEEEPERRTVQTLRDPAVHGGEGTQASPVSVETLESSQGGAPLSSTARQFMEPRFGADFSRVLVHADWRAAELARSLSARAFTFGQHLYFNDGEYRPDTGEGRRVLAHELTHVIQQDGGASALPIRQRAGHREGSHAAPTIQRIGGRGKLLKSDVAPWGGDAPKGTNFEVSTDGGSKVTAWVPYFIYEENLLYWCHGHSLGTADKFSYSVYSGSDIETVVKDEWTNVAPEKTKAGDIAVWTGHWGHSALFTKPVIESGALNRDKSLLSTKNGQQSLAVKTLTDIEGTYGNVGIASFRHK